jgi:hypothetical protein
LGKGGRSVGAAAPLWEIEKLSTRKWNLKSLLGSELWIFYLPITKKSERYDKHSFTEPLTLQIEVQTKKSYVRKTSWYSTFLVTWFLQVWIARIHAHVEPAFYTTPFLSRTTSMFIRHTLINNLYYYIKSKKNYIPKYPLSNDLN